MAKISIVEFGDVLRETGVEFLTQQSLYNQAEYCQLIKPGSFRYARLDNPSGAIFLPFTGKRFLWKYRLFMLPFCQRFTPFNLNGTAAFANYQTDWLSWLRLHSISCHWSFFSEGNPQDSGAVIRINQYLNLQDSFINLLALWKKGRKSALSKSEHQRLEELSHESFRKCLLQLNGATPGKGWRPTAKERNAILDVSSSIEFSKSVSRFAVMDGSHCLNLILLLKWNNRYHYLFSQSSDEGFRCDSLTRFFYEWLNIHAGEDAILDFEGSNLPGVQAYFASLGATKESYYSIQRPLSFR